MGRRVGIARPGGRLARLLVAVVACEVMRGAAPAAASPTFVLPVRLQDLGTAGASAIVPSPSGGPARVFSIESGGALVARTFDASGARLSSTVLVPAGVQSPLRVADVDGDGVLDLVSGGANALEFRRGRADGTFEPAVSSPVTGNYWSFATLADVNGDGRLDAVTYNYPGIAVLLADSTGHFVPLPLSVTQGLDVGRVMAGRFDDDDVWDIVARNTSGTGFYSLYHGLGDGRFEYAGDIASTPVSCYVTVATDFDGNGRMDLAYMAYDNVTGGLVAKVLLNPGDIRDGAWTTVSNLRVNYSDAGLELAAGDVNGDGAPDLVAIGYEPDMQQSPNGGLAIGFNDGHGGFGPVRRYDLTSTGGGWSRSVGDIDGDGHPDVLVDGRVLIRGLGGLALAAPQRVVSPAKTPPGAVAVRLRHAPGRDLVGFSAQGNGDSAFVLRRTTDGTYEPGVFLRADLHAYAWADEDGDALDDWLGPTADGAGICWWRSDGDGGFTPGPASEPLSGTLVGVADVDGDGIADLVERSNDGATLRRGLADGSFLPPEDTGLRRIAAYDSLGWGDALLADLTGDGRPELVMLGERGCDPAWVVEAWRNDGHGHFTFADTAAVYYVMPSGAAPTCAEDQDVRPRLMAGDVDGDGFADVVVPRGHRVFDWVQDYCLDVFRSDGAAGLSFFSTAPIPVDDGTMVSFGPDRRATLVSVFGNSTRDGWVETSEWAPGGGAPATKSTEIVYRPMTLAVADLDGLGAPAVVTCTQLYPYGGSSNAIVTILRTVPPEVPTPALAALVSACAVDGRVEIEWQVSDAPASLEVERTLDRTAWSTLARVSPDGTGRVRFTDAAPPAGAEAGYRLAWTEDGRRVTAASAFVAVPAAPRFGLRALCSAGRTLAFALESPVAGEARVELFDVAGRRVADERVRVGPSAAARLSPGARLAPGLYLARARLGARVAVTRAVVLR